MPESCSTMRAWNPSSQTLPHTLCRSPSSQNSSTSTDSTHPISSESMHPHKSTIPFSSHKSLSFPSVFTYCCSLSSPPLLSSSQSVFLALFHWQVNWFFGWVPPSSSLFWCRVGGSFPSWNSWKLQSIYWLIFRNLRKISPPILLSSVLPPSFFALLLFRHDFFSTIAPLSIPKTRLDP